MWKIAKYPSIAKHWLKYSEKQKQLYIEITRVQSVFTQTVKISIGITDGFSWNEVLLKFKQNLQMHIGGSLKLTFLASIMGVPANNGILHC